MYIPGQRDVCCLATLQAPLCSSLWWGPANLRSIHSLCTGACSLTLLALMKAYCHRLRDSLLPVY